MIKTKLILASLSLVLAGAFTAQAQTDTAANSSYRASDEFGARSGSWEFTLGGAGGSNKALNNSLGGVNASVGFYLSDTFEISVRQSGNYSNGTGTGGANYDGSTFVAADHHFGTGRLRPFVGLNFGALYGDSTNDTFAAGIEGGLKFYVQAKTFLFAMANYAWTFNDTKKVSDNFDDGAFLWSVGVGFNF
ncbi:MAG TPA: hypothetical protein VK968_05695 [Roseimicrobium sp.]|nr:hypothetical protein [Roseimicrobium sp.]